MTHLGAGLKTIVDNGRERRTDGLLKHLGVIDAGMLRAVANPNTLQTGAGLELLYDPSGTAYIQPIDRNVGQYRDLRIDARNVSIMGQAGGKVSLPQGTAQAMIGSYQAAPAWSTTTNAWLETPVAATVTCTGGLLRLEAMAMVTHSAAGAGVFFAFFMDGALWSPTLAVINVPGSYIGNETLIFYATPAAGNHRFALGLYNGSGGTLSLYTGAYQSLWVTEQRA